MAYAPSTFYWYDYETFGINRWSDRPAQFAGLRTDLNFNPVEGEGEVLYAKPSLDYLPSPESALLTGITPQLCEERGLCESDLAGAIHKRLAAPGTVSIGYNSIGFDDEVNRFLFWRNFLPPYDHTWRDGCSRWDLFPVVCAVWALRGETIRWPRWEEQDVKRFPQAEGRTGVSFKLEFLTQANGLEHAHAHDALSDVHATIALAQLVAEREPKLWRWAFENRTKQKVSEALEKGPVVWVSPKFGVARGCTRIVMQILREGNEALMWDLSEDPEVLRRIPLAELERRFLASSKTLPEGEMPLPVYRLKVNGSPFVCSSLGVLNADRAARFGIDIARCKENARRLAQILPEVLESLRFASEAAERRREDGRVLEVEESLYGGKWTSDADAKRMREVRRASPEKLAEWAAAGRVGFEDPRFEELFERWRARNWPETLTPEERARWRSWCERHVIDGEAGSRTVGEYFEEIDRLQADPANDAEEVQNVLEALYEWGERVGEAATSGDEGLF